MAHDNALFLSPVVCGMGDELAIVEIVGNCEMTLLGLG